MSHAPGGPALRVFLVALAVLAAMPPAVAPAGNRPVVASTQELAVLRGSMAVMSAPGGHSVLRVLSHWLPLTGEARALPVIGQSTGGSGVPWLHVLLPGRPNGQTGWIRRQATVAASTSWHLVIDLSERRVTVYQRGLQVHMFEAVVGKAATPTPRGEFFVEEAVVLQADAAGAPFALALSARSNVLRVYDSGPGQIALHGTANVGGTLGSAASHGCIRLNTSAIRWLAYRIGAGVPVTITD